jgi:hypothetical protein
MALKETVRFYTSKKSVGRDSKPIARLNIVVQAESQSEANNKAKARMEDFISDGELGKCHYKSTEKDITHYCYLAY